MLGNHTVQFCYCYAVFRMISVQLTRLFLQHLYIVLWTFKLLYSLYGCPKLCTCLSSVKLMY